MVLYYCKFCNKPFSTKQEYAKHQKIHENTTHATTIQTTHGRLECQFCANTFANKHTLKSHTEKYCKLSIHQQLKDSRLEAVVRIAKLEAKFEAKQRELEDKIIAHDKKFDTVNETVNNVVNSLGNSTTNITNNIINVQVNNQIFYIKDFSNEHPIKNALTYAQMNHVIQLGGNSVSKLVEYKHYNRELPENHNILIKKKKANVAYVFEGHKFKEVEIEKVLDYLINTSQNEITEILKTPGITINYQQQRHINNLQLKIKENYPATISMLKEELRKLMMANSKLVMDTYKKMVINLETSTTLENINEKLGIEETSESENDNINSITDQNNVIIITV